MDILKHLVELGPRWSGRPAVLQAADYMAATFADAGFAVERQTYPFTGWETDRLPRLEVLEPETGIADAALMEYSGSTPEGGVTGRLRRAGEGHMVPGLLDWPRYAIVDDAGDVLAYLIGHVGLGGWQAPAIPLHSPEPFIPWPMAIVSQDDHERFAAWLDEGRPVRVRFDTAGHLVSPLFGHNVIATLPGRTERTVVFSAHLDTAWGTPGACNNAGGLQAMFDLACRLREVGPHNVTYRFLACDGGEWHYLGANHFLQNEQEEGRLGQIVAGINIDTITTGDQLFFLASTLDMRRRAEAVVEQLDLDCEFREIIYLGALRGSDHYAFIQAGIPASEIMFWPCTRYKLPSDDLSGVELPRVRLAVDIAAALGATFAHEQCEQ